MSNVMDFSRIRKERVQRSKEVDELSKNMLEELCGLPWEKIPYPSKVIKGMYEGQNLADSVLMIKYSDLAVAIVPSLLSLPEFKDVSSFEIAYRMNSTGTYVTLRPVKDTGTVDGKGIVVEDLFIASCIKNTIENEIEGG